MTFTYRYCPGCGTRRVASGYACTVCGGPVRRTQSPVAAERPPAARPRPFDLGWHVIADHDRVAAPPSAAGVRR